MKLFWYQLFQVPAWNPSSDEDEVRNRRFLKGVAAKKPKIGGEMFSKRVGDNLKFK